MIKPISRERQKVVVDHRQLKKVARSSFSRGARHIKTPWTSALCIYLMESWLAYTQRWGTTCSIFHSRMRQCEKNGIFQAPGRITTPRSAIPNASLHTLSQIQAASIAISNRWCLINWFLQMYTATFPDGVLYIYVAMFNRRVIIFCAFVRWPPGGD